MSRRFKVLEDDEDMSDSDYKFNWYSNNRFFCSVLDDMRGCDKSKNYAPMAGLIDELQAIGNRMEAGLADQKSLLELSEEYSKARKAYKELKKEYKQLLSKTKKLRKKKD